jgi:hypothetical protein
VPKKVLLPDYSNAHSVWGRDFFPEEKANELARRYRFKPDFDLYEKLNDAAAWLAVFSNHGDESPTVQRRELETLQKRASSLLEALRKLGHHASVRVMLKATVTHSINVNGPGDVEVTELPEPIKQIDLHAFEQDVQKFTRVVTVAVNGLRDAKKWQPRKDIERVFAASVREIYVEGTGNDDKPKHDRENETYYGDFFFFFVECMKGVRLYKGGEQMARLAGEACRAQSATGSKNQK